MNNYVIVYDIEDDKRRNKVFKLLKEFITPVQYSVFEGRIDPCNFLMLEERLKGIIDDGVDSIIIYNQCESCTKNVKRLGVESFIYGNDDILI